MTGASRWPGRKPRILVVLLAMNLLLLALPLGGLWLLRLYESALVRQTEAELVAQAAVIGAAYRAAWLQARGVAAAEEPGERWQPRFPALDLARDPVLPPPRPGEPAAADATAAEAGAAVAALLPGAQRQTLAAMRVVDRRGVVVASSGEEMGLGLGARPEVAAALSGSVAAVLRARADRVRPRPAAGSISRGSTLRVFLALPVHAGGEVVGAVVLSRTPAGVEQVLHAWRWELAGLAAALLAAAGAMAAFVAYAVGRPIRAVARQAQAVAAGATASLAPVRGSAVREADELWEATSRMAGTLERRAEYIRGFATEVSHELKTPIAALRGALEILEDHGATMRPEERARFMAQAARDAERLDRLVRRLLELARAEAPLPAGGVAEIGAAVRAAAAPFREAGMVVTAEGPALRVAMAEDALRGVIGPLLENVRQHAGPGARCAVTWHAAGGMVELTVEDDGPGISAGNAARVFDRFFTTAREEGGTGLGLAIARGRVEAAGGHIALRPSARGARFAISLKPA